MIYLLENVQYDSFIRMFHSYHIIHMYVSFKHTRHPYMSCICTCHTFHSHVRKIHAKYDLFARECAIWLIHMYHPIYASPIYVIQTHLPYVCAVIYIIPTCHWHISAIGLVHMCMRNMTHSYVSFTQSYASLTYDFFICVCAIWLIHMYVCNMTHSHVCMQYDSFVCVIQSYSSPI